MKPTLHEEQSILNNTLNLYDKMERTLGIYNNMEQYYNENSNNKNYMKPINKQYNNDKL